MKHTEEHRRFYPLDQFINDAIALDGKIRLRGLPIKFLWLVYYQTRFDKNLPILKLRARIRKFIKGRTSHE